MVYPVWESQRTRSLKPHFVGLFFMYCLKENLAFDRTILSSILISASGWYKFLYCELVWLTRVCTYRTYNMTKLNTVNISYHAKYMKCIPTFATLSFSFFNSSSVFLSTICKNANKLSNLLRLMTSASPSQSVLGYFFISKMNEQSN